MTRKSLFAALVLVCAISPAAAAQPDATPEKIAPAAAPDAKYCLRVEPVTGSRIEMVRC
jgi:hypothetical protein